MLTQPTAISANQVAVLEYFAGERREMFLILAFALGVAALALWLFIATRAGFAMAFMITVLLFGGLMSAGIVSLMIRDQASSRVLSLSLQTEQSATAIAGEKARIDVVLSKFKYYRFGAAVLGVLAMVGFMLSGRGWVHGVAAGLLLVVVAQVVIDHFSERRAQIYLKQLTTLS